MNTPGETRGGEGVDLAQTEGGFAVTNTWNREWLDYLLTVREGTYRMRLKVAQPDSGTKVLVQLDGVLLGVVDITQTEGWTDWDTVILPKLFLDPSEDSLLRITFIGPDSVSTCNLDWIAFEDEQSAFHGTPFVLPGVIEAEDFDRGGQDISYFEADADINSSEAYRVEDVDLLARPEARGGRVVSGIQDGEWLEYTVDLESDRYAIEFFVASPDSGSQVTLKLDGELLGKGILPSTGGWESWESLRIDEIQIAGGKEHVLRLKFSGTEGMELARLDWIRVVKDYDQGDLVGYWTFDEESGLSLHDHAGSTTNTGVLVDEPE